MPQSKNMARLSEDMKRELIAIIGGDERPPACRGFLTVMRVEVAPDLSTAKVHVSKMGEENATAEAVGALNPPRATVRSGSQKRMHIRKGAGIPLRGGRRREVCGAHQWVIAGAGAGEALTRARQGYPKSDE